MITTTFNTVHYVWEAACFLSEAFCFRIVLYCVECCYDNGKSTCKYCWYCW